MVRLLVVAGAVSCIFMCAMESQAQTLVHKWSFENNYNDTSGSNNTGTPSGAPAFVGGKFGQAVSIVSPADGVHVNAFANNLPLQGTAAWSMSVWAKLAAAPANLEYLAGWGINDGFVGALDTAAARAMIAFGGAANNNMYFWGGSRDVNSGTQYIADNNWHMYTVTYSGTAMQFYKDGQPVLATPVNLTLNSALDEIHVGNPSNWNSNFDGSLDEFSIYSGSLSAGQVGGLFFNNNINQPVVFDPSFTVNRTTGEIVLNNNSNFAIEVLGYTIRSASGSVNPTDWHTIAGRYDSPPGGDGSIDSNDDWTVLTNTSQTFSTELSEGVPGTDGGTIAIGKVVSFGSSWVANPREDLVIDLLLDDGLGTVKTYAAQYTGNGDHAYGIADLDTDGDVDLNDWTIFRSSTAHSFTGKTLAEAYLNGDLDGDLDKDINDFNIFVKRFNAGMGAGAFEALVGSVPEPSTLMLLPLALLAWFGRARRRIALAAACGVAAVTLTTGEASAVLWGYYPLNANPNEATTNNINLTPIGDTTYAGSVHPGLNASASFDGNGDGLIGGNFNKFQTNDVTVVAWAYADSLAGDWNTIIKNWGTSAGGQFHLGLGSLAANTLQNFIAGGTNVTAPATTLFPEKTWVHTAFVLDSVAQEHRLYMNGQIVATGAYSGTLGLGTPAITGLGIGHKPNDDGTAISNNGPGPWNGRIDDVGLFDTAKTTAEIQQIYQNGLAGIQLDGTTSPYVSLQVDRSNGTVKVRNTTGGAVSLNAYEIASAGGWLNATNWQDLAGNVGFPTGNGSGNGWEKDAGSNSSQLLETFLTGNSSLAAGGEISIGNVYSGSAEDVKFRYRNSDGVVIDSIVQYIGVAPGLIGDYNNNGKVDGADYVVWRKRLNTAFALPNEDLTVTPGQVTAADYTVWRSHFGNSAGTGASLSPVPEPVSCGLILSLAFCLGGVTRFGRRVR